MTKSDSSDSEPQTPTVPDNKRQVSQKRLEALAKARAVRLQQRKQDAEVSKKQKAIKHLSKQKKTKEVENEYEDLLLQLEEIQDKHDMITKRKEKAQRKPKPKVVSESESDESESPKPKRRTKSKPITTQGKKATDVVENASKQVIQDRITQLRNEMLYNSIFPKD